MLNFRSCFPSFIRNEKAKVNHSGKFCINLNIGYPYLLLLCVTLYRLCTCYYYYYHYNKKSIQYDTMLLKGTLITKIDERRYNKE